MADHTVVGMVADMAVGKVVGKAVDTDTKD